MGAASSWLPSLSAQNTTSHLPTAQEDHVYDSSTLTNEPDHSPLPLSQPIGTGIVDVSASTLGDGNGLKLATVEIISTSPSDHSSPSPQSSSSRSAFSNYSDSLPDYSDDTAPPLGDICDLAVIPSPTIQPLRMNSFLRQHNYRDYFNSLPSISNNRPAMNGPRSDSIHPGSLSELSPLLEFPSLHSDGTYLLDRSTFPIADKFPLNEVIDGIPVSLSPSPPLHHSQPETVYEVPVSALSCQIQPLSKESPLNDEIGDFSYSSSQLPSLSAIVPPSPISTNIGVDPEAFNHEASGALNDETSVSQLASSSYQSPSANLNPFDIEIDLKTRSEPDMAPLSNECSVSTSLYSHSPSPSLIAHELPQTVSDIVVDKLLHNSGVAISFTEDTMEETISSIPSASHPSSSQDDPPISLPLQDVEPFKVENLGVLEESITILPNSTKHIPPLVTHLGPKIPSIGSKPKAVEQAACLLKDDKSRNEIREYISLSQSYFIDGDSLVFFLASLSSSIANPYQTLSIFYLIERYLSDMQQFGGQFVVVFFLSSIFAYTPLPPIWFSISQSLRLHLMRLTSIRVELVDSCDSEAYKVLLEEWRPGFILTTIKTRLWGGKDARRDIREKRKLTYAKANRLRSIFFHLRAGISVGDVGDVKFGDTTHLTIIEAWNPGLAQAAWKAIRLHPPLSEVDVLHELFKGTLVPANWLLNALIKKHPHLQLDDDYSEILNPGPFGDRPLSWTATAIDITLRISLHTRVLRPSWVKSFLVYVLFQSHLSVYDRVELKKDNLEDNGNDNSSFHVTSFIKILTCVGISMASSVSPSPLMRFDVADTFDLALFNRVFSQLRILGRPCSDPLKGTGEFKDGANLMQHTKSTFGFHFDMFKELEMRWNYISAGLPSQGDVTEDLDTFYDKDDPVVTFFPFIIETNVDLKALKHVGNDSPSSSINSGPSSPDSNFTLWPVRYRLVDSVMTADGTPLPSQTSEFVTLHLQGLPHTLRFADDRHWRSRKLIVASESVYMDDGSSGKVALESYVKKLAEALTAKNPPPIPPFLDGANFSSSSIVSAHSQLQLADIELPKFSELPNSAIWDLRQEVARRDTKTLKDRIIRLRDIVLLNFEIYKGLYTEKDAKLVDLPRTEECRAQVVIAILQAVGTLLSTPFWTNFDLEKVFGEVCDGMNLKALKDTFSKPAKGKLPMNVSPRLQLNYLGPLMQKDTQSVLDPRVSFSPDPWQVEVLDGIDAAKSLLVTAPTSSGKSFISFYAMERQLKVKNSDSIVIFVAPTIALVNQVQAEVYLKFAKKYPQSDGVSVFGSFTRDMRVVPTNCRILVTVPACLEILLLSPPLQLTWVSRIRCIIFDEIHTISGDESSVLARLLALAPCPFIALSATIGSPKLFHEYLETLSSRQVVVVDHTKRYNDIEKHFIEFARVKGPAAKGKKKNAEEEKKNESKVLKTHYWHPWNGARLAFFDPNLPPAPFSPRDSLVLYEAIERACAGFKMISTADNKKVVSCWKEVQELSPERFFTSHPLTQEMTRRYEHELKNWYLQLVSASINVGDTRFADLILRELNAPTAGLQSARSGPSVQLRGYFASNVMTVVQRLLEDDKLPAIFFNFERAFCELIAEELYQSFLENDSSGENLQPSPSNPPPISKQAKKSNPAPVVRKVSQLRRLTSDGEIMEASVLDEELKNLKQVLGKFKDGTAFLWAVDAIRYGIGIHHSGMRKEYKDAVERYFRLRQIKVVFATGTLAVGINMPCRSTVFMGDSPHLTPQQYRQMCGRAGRRGVDDLGHAYFWGISIRRIAHLELSQLTPIHGFFPLSISTTLRATILESHVRSLNLPPKKLSQIDPSIRLFNLYRNSLYLHKRTERWAQIWIHTACTMEYLASEGMMTLDGTPLNMAGLVAHTSWTEPSNLVVARFLISPLAKQMAERWQANADKVCDELVHFFATLFNRENSSKISKRLSKEAKLEGCDHSVALDPLPSEFETFIFQHRTQCFDIANRAIRYFIDTHLEESGKTKQMDDPTHPHENLATRIEPVVLRSESSLPLSGEGRKLSFDHGTLKRSDPADSKAKGGANSAKSKRSKVSDKFSSNLVSGVLRCAAPPKLLSPFAAMTSMRDRIVSVADLRLLRQGLELSNLALLSNQESLLSNDDEINAYVLDMYRFENYDWLVKYNRIRPNDLRRNLKDFLLILLTISRSCSLFFKDPSEQSIVGMLRDVSERFNIKFANLFATDLIALPDWSEKGASASDPYSNAPKFIRSDQPHTASSSSSKSGKETKSSSKLPSKSSPQSSNKSHQKALPAKTSTKISNKATSSNSASSSIFMVLSSSDGDDVEDDLPELTMPNDDIEVVGTVPNTDTGPNAWCTPYDQFNGFSHLLLSGPLPPPGDEIYTRYKSEDLDKLEKILQDDFDAFWIRRYQQFDNVFNNRNCAIPLGPSSVLIQYSATKVRRLKDHYLFYADPSTLTIHERAARMAVLSTRKMSTKMHKLPEAPMVPDPKALQLLYRVTEVRTLNTALVSSHILLNPFASYSALQSHIESKQMLSDSIELQTTDMASLSSGHIFIAISCHLPVIQWALHSLGVDISAIHVADISKTLFDALTKLTKEFVSKKTSAQGPHTLIRIYAEFFQKVPLLGPMVRYTVDLKSLEAILDVIKTVVLAHELRQSLTDQGSFSQGPDFIEADRLIRLASCPAADAQWIRDYFNASKPVGLELFDIMVSASPTAKPKQKNKAKRAPHSADKPTLLWSCHFNPFLFCFGLSHPMGIWTSEAMRAAYDMPMVGDFGILALSIVTLGNCDIVRSSPIPSILPIPSSPFNSILYHGRTGPDPIWDAAPQLDGTIVTVPLGPLSSLQADSPHQHCEYILKDRSQCEFKYFVLVRRTKF